MPTQTDIKNLKISYTCPECSQRIEKEVPYVSGDNGKVSLISAGWCIYKYCEARHKLDYKVVDKNDIPVIQEVIFSSNGIEHEKRIKILAFG